MAQRGITPALQNGRSITCSSVIRPIKMAEARPTANKIKKSVHRKRRDRILATSSSTFTLTAESPRHHLRQNTHPSCSVICSMRAVSPLFQQQLAPLGLELAFPVQPLKLSKLYPPYGWWSLPRLVNKQAKNSTIMAMGHRRRRSLNGHLPSAWKPNAPAVQCSLLACLRAARITALRARGLASTSSSLGRLPLPNASRRRFN